MSKKKIALIIGVVIIVIAVAAFSILYLPTMLPRATTLSVSPSTFTVYSTESIALVASVTSDGITLTGSNIVWKADTGIFDKNVGSSVIYKAPEVSTETKVTITVEFPGEGSYQPSKVTVTGTILPKPATSTVLTIVPSTFEITSGEQISLRAEITPKDAPIDIVKWSLEGPGTLSSTSGPTTTYTSPTVEVETTVKIVAEFPGTKEYGKSMAEVVGKILPKGVAVRKATTLTVTPSTFTVTASGEVTLTAELKDVDGNVLTGKTVNWVLEGPGSLSSTTGLTVTYKAPPEVKEETVIKIKAEFSGDKDYLPASAEVVGKITTMPSIAEYAYQMEFEKIIFKNVKIEGPISMLGVKATKISGENAEIKNLLLKPMGLKSEDSTFQKFEIYTIDLTGQSPELGEKLQITGEQQISLTKDTLTIEGGQAKIIYIVADAVKLNKPELVGKHVGGDEPYIPVIVTAHSVVLKEGYFLEGPKTYEELVNKVNKLTAGKVEATDFTFTYPEKYSLDRSSNEFSYTGVWKLSSSKLSGQKILIYLIYFEAKYGGITVRGTGEETASQIIPHGFNSGYESPPLPDAGTHAVYFSADSLDLEKLVLQITP
jgi:hypothetical protein